MNRPVPHLIPLPAAVVPPDGAADAASSVVVDCDGCTARPLACGDCVVTVLLGSPPEGVELDDQEQAALAVLARSGLVPALQYEPVAHPHPSQKSHLLHRSRDA